MRTRLTEGLAGAMSCSFLTICAKRRPQALHNDLRPSGPRRHSGLLVVRQDRQKTSWGSDGLLRLCCAFIFCFSTDSVSLNEALLDDDEGDVMDAGAMWGDENDGVDGNEHDDDDEEDDEEDEEKVVEEEEEEGLAARWLGRR